MSASVVSPPVEQPAAAAYVSPLSYGLPQQHAVYHSTPHVAAPAVTYSHHPVSYAAAPVTHTAAPVTTASPITYAHHMPVHTYAAPAASYSYHDPTSLAPAYSTVHHQVVEAATSPAIVDSVAPEAEAPVSVAPITYHHALPTTSMYAPQMYSHGLPSAHSMVAYPGLPTAGSMIAYSHSPYQFTAAPEALATEVSAPPAEAEKTPEVADAAVVAKPAKAKKSSKKKKASKKSCC